MQHLGAYKKKKNSWVGISAVFTFCNLQDADSLYRRERKLEIQVSIRLGFQHLRPPAVPNTSVESLALVVLIA